MTLPAFEPARQIYRHVCRRTLRTPWRSLSLGLPTIGTKASMADSNLAVMSEDEVIVAWGINNGSLTTYVKERH